MRVMENNKLEVSISEGITEVRSGGGKTKNKQKNTLEDRGAENKEGH